MPLTEGSTCDTFAEWSLRRPEDPGSKVDISNFMEDFVYSQPYGKGKKIKKKRPGISPFKRL